MNISIINIGDELLIGQVVNTNASTMSKMLIAAGIDVRETAVIADSREAIIDTLSRHFETYDAVIMTGGLGPTKDDVTKKVLCEYFQSELEENATVLDNVKRIFEARGYELTEINRQQAWVPKCCTVINNVMGTAPGMWFEKEGKIVVSLPGVPFEMENLMRTEVIGRLQKHFNTGCIVNKNILVQGIGESFLSDMIEPWELGLPDNIKLAYLPQAGMVKLRLTARGENKEILDEAIVREVKKLYLLAGDYIVGEDMETLPEALAQIMKLHGKTLATAESCTGGAIASKITAMAGASTFFNGGVVAYSNAVKMSTLGVKSKTLEMHGAVSEETVREMATGVRERLGADYGVATSGIAGPGGGTAEKPVGTVWIALAGPDGVETRLKKYGDDRIRTIERTCNEVFSMLIHSIKTPKEQLQ
ncbi:MAG: competence/damage-inducible protein A [Bacteroidales bacterium]|nr:competence/damage-inducible protein A [Bacteroidales bacterium]